MDDLSERLVDGLGASYGVHPGHRAAHAKGVLCRGSFTPSPEATGFSRAAHLTSGELAAHIRFSNGSGDPHVADGVRDGRGMAVKLYLGDGSTTDIVALSLPVFFVRTPEDLVAFSEARRPDPATGELDMEKVGAFLAAHPETVPAATAAITQPIPVSFATVAYHGLHAFGFDTADGATRWGRLHLVPVAGEQGISDDEAASRPADYLGLELADRLGAGPASFDLVVERAGPDDPLDDPTAPWPDDRERTTLGRLQVESLADDRDHGDDVLVFDPTRIPDGMRLPDDPILLARPGAYSVSVARRVAARPHTG
jgi:catalase